MPAHARVASSSSEADTAPPSDATRNPGSLVKDYLLENVPEYRHLVEQRQMGWDSQAADAFFEQQRQQADTANEKTAKFFYDMMKHIGDEMQRVTGALKVLRRGASKCDILDVCAAPGGFLATAMKLNPGAEAVGFTLPPSQGGHKVQMPWTMGSDVTFRYTDVTMLAADMGFTDIPAEHPDAQNFVLQRQIDAEQSFDLVLCDGKVLRTHARAEYREWREARRLISTQLAVGLEHVRSGGTMIVLLHKVEAWETVCLLYAFSKFASIKLFKPRRAHAKRSSFYMVATGIQSQSPQAKAAVERWKRHWRVATFGSEEECSAVFSEPYADEERLMEEFGPALARLGRKIWDIQGRALEKAPFMTPARLDDGQETAQQNATTALHAL